MNIIQEIESIADEKNIVIDYRIHDQIEEGHYPDIINKLKTYTITIMKKSSYSGEMIESQSFDHLREGLEWAVNFVKKEY